MNVNEVLSKSLPDTLDTWDDQVRWYNEHVAELKHWVEVKNNDADNRYQALITARTEHRKDIDKIGTALMEEAQSRAWCDDYDKFVERLNRTLIIGLAEREHDYEIQVEYIVQVSTVVTARNDSDANEIAKNMDLSDFNVSISGDYDNIEYHDHEVQEA